MIPPEIIKQIRLIEIKTKKIVNNLFGGEYQSAFKGAGIEFSEVRKYVPGDDIRGIDWNVTARAGNPYIKKFNEERELTVIIMIDVSGSQYYGTGDMLKSDLIIQIASILSFSAIKNNDKVGLILFSDKIEKYIPAQKGKTHTLRVIREMINYKGNHEYSDLNNALEHSLKVLKRKSIIFLLSDFWAYGYQENMKRVNKKHDLINIHLSDPSEKKMFPYGMLKLEDAETRKQYWIDMNEKNIKTISREYEVKSSNLNKFCKKNNIDLIKIENNDNFIDPLINFFNSRMNK